MLGRGIIMNTGIYKEILLKGLRSGLEVTWMLAKVIVPVYFAVTFLEATPVIGWIAKGMEPLMVLLGLPGEATIPLVFGNVMGLYAGIGAIKAMSFSTREITIMGIMLTFSHALPIETSVIRGIGVKGWPVVLTRLGLALGSGIIFNLVL